MPVPEASNSQVHQIGTFTGGYDTQISDQQARPGINIAAEEMTANIALPLHGQSRFVDEDPNRTLRAGEINTGSSNGKKNSSAAEPQSRSSEEDLFLNLAQMDVEASETRDTGDQSEKRRVSGSVLFSQRYILTFWLVHFVNDMFQSNCYVQWRLAVPTYYYFPLNNITSSLDVLLASQTILQHTLR